MQDQYGQLERLGEDWAAAELRDDTATLWRLLAEDFVAVGPRGFVLTNKQWLSRHDSGSLTYTVFEWDDVSVRVHGNAAVMVGRQTASAVYTDGKVRHEIQDQFRTTLIFVEEQGRWQLLGVHLSPIAGLPAGQEKA
jgi:ketosteroid isomerase-like protein